ncbi:MAG: S1 RNA-binding domain-containing protein, partial [Planctomycetes bacterium]|nr:S1 RNA-binding domain-containing protein [Planctomycetota bacterium]
MAGQKGRLFVLKAGDGGGPESFITIGGLRPTSFVINNAEVDVSDKDSAGKRELLADAGLQSVAITAGGVFKDSAGEEIIRATLVQSREARIEILRSMLSTIPRPRETTAESAPRLLRTKINPDKIGLLIGPGGKTIRGIQEDVGCTIDVEEDGTVTVAAANQEMAEAGLARVDALTASVQVGKIYDGTVTSVKDFGAFVEIPGGKDGLIRISELANMHVPRVGDIVDVGDEVKVKVMEVDSMGRINLSRK